MELLKKHKLMVMATLLIGHWEETEEDRKAFLKFFGKYVDHFGLNLITPLPGTPLFYQMKQMGRIMDWDYRNYDYLHAVMPTQGGGSPGAGQSHLQRDHEAVLLAAQGVA